MKGSIDSHLYRLNVARLIWSLYYNERIKKIENQVMYRSN